MRVCSFFAGIGGFDLGFQRASGVPVFHCEINPFCLSVLRRHWPKVPTSEDVRLVKSIDIPEAEIWCGGFPCQDVSVARGWLGREGLSGQNSGLFYPFIRLIQERVPEVVVLENVSGLLNSHGGRDFASIIEKFDSLGYGVAWRVLNTRYFGAPQSRPRVYVCAWHGSPEKAVKVLYEQGATHQPENPRLGFLRESRCKATGAYVPEVAFCLAATSGRHTGTDWSRSYVAYKNEVRRLTPSECERIQGFPTGWALPQEDFRLTEEAMDSVRYHAVGNAVSVPVVEWIAKRVESEMRRPSTDFPESQFLTGTIGRFGCYVHDFSSSKAAIRAISDVSTRDETTPIKWGSGGVVDDGLCISASVSSSPVVPVPSRFVDLLDEARPHDRYFLTPNAATGILRRVRGQRRELFKPLDSALIQLQQLGVGS